MLKAEKRKKIIKRIVILLLLVIAGVVLYFVKFKKKPSTTAQAGSTTAEVTVADVQTQISGKGTLNPKDQYEVKSLVKGEILKAPFEEGDKIEKDSLLYKVSTTGIQNTIDTADQTVRKAQDSYEEAKEEMNTLKLKATESGYVKKVYVKQGDTIAAGADIADIYDDSSMDLKISFPESAVSSGSVGRKATVYLEGSSEKLYGKIKQVNRVTDSLDGGIIVKEVTIDVKNPGALKSGQRATASIGGVDGVSIGTFAEKTNAKITAATAGKIESLNIKEGEWISKDSVYAQLSSKELEKSLQTAKDSLEEAKQAKATQKKQLDEYRLTSPISGTVITKNKKKGDMIDPSTMTDPMAIVYDLTELVFQMNVDEMDISKITEGMKVSVTAGAFPEDVYEGVVEKISIKGTTENGMTTYPVKVRLTEYGNLLPGMNVTAEIITAEAKGVLTIPSACLQRGNIVYVKDKDGAKTEDKKATDEAQQDGMQTITVPKGFSPVEVTVGLNDGMTCEIQSGLSEGDVVYVPFDYVNPNAQFMNDMGDGDYEEGSVG